MIIYKITNIINNKVYIGLTTNSLEFRWKQHLRELKRPGQDRHLYLSMKKYGIENFKIEEIDKANSLDELGELERYYIKLYQSNNRDKGYNMTAGGDKPIADASPTSKLTLDDVIFIREIYKEGKIRCIDCWNMYFNDKISFYGFSSIWNGKTWKSVMYDETFTEENKEKHKHMSGNIGSKNPNSFFTDEEIMSIRIYYSSHTLKQTFEFFKEKIKSISKRSLSYSLIEGYKNIPRYYKKEKKWLLNEKEINIEDYKPVSTISESGE